MSVYEVSPFAHVSIKRIPVAPGVPACGYMKKNGFYTSRSHTQTRVSQRRFKLWIKRREVRFIDYPLHVFHIVNTKLPGFPMTMNTKRVCMKLKSNDPLTTLPFRVRNRLRMINAMKLKLNMKRVRKRHVWVSKLTHPYIKNIVKHFKNEVVRLSGGYAAHDLVSLYTEALKRDDASSSIIGRSLHSFEIDCSQQRVAQDTVFHELSLKLTSRYRDNKKREIIVQAISIAEQYQKQGWASALCMALQRDKELPFTIRLQSCVTEASQKLGQRLSGCMGWNKDGDHDYIFSK